MTYFSGHSGPVYGLDFRCTLLLCYHFDHAIKQWCRMPLPSLLMAAAVALAASLYTRELLPFPSTLLPAVPTMSCCSARQRTALCGEAASWTVLLGMA